MTAPCFLGRFRSPRPPTHRILRVLEQIGARCRGEAVGHSCDFPRASEESHDPRGAAAAVAAGQRTPPPRQAAARSASQGVPPAGHQRVGGRASTPGLTRRPREGPEPRLVELSGATRGRVVAVRRHGHRPPGETRDAQRALAPRPRLGRGERPRQRLAQDDRLPQPPPLRRDQVVPRGARRTLGGRRPVPRPATLPVATHLATSSPPSSTTTSVRARTPSATRCPS